MTDPADRTGPSLLRGRVTLLDGERLSLPSLRGKVVLVVNTASQCGDTDQLGGIESLHQRRRGEGLVVPGVPSDDFQQEPDRDGGVAGFCEMDDGVPFTMTSLSRATGEGATPPFAANADRPAPAGGEPVRNFTTYVLDRDGRPAARSGSVTEPDAPELTAVLDEPLAEA